MVASYSRRTSVYTLIMEVNSLIEYGPISVTDLTAEP